jgi:hypothetical protein
VDIATRKLICRLAELDGEEADPTEMSMVEIVNRSVENVERLTDRIEELEAQVEVLEERAPDPSKKQYDEMDRSDKAAVVRSKLKNEAESTTGTAKATYKDVVRIFDGQPSAGHSYDIMDTAAEGDGFNLGTSPDGTKRLTYNERRA